MIYHLPSLQKLGLCVCIYIDVDMYICKYTFLNVSNTCQYVFQNSKQMK